MKPAPTRPLYNQVHAISSTLTALYKNQIRQPITLSNDNELVHTNPPPTPKSQDNFKDEVPKGGQLHMTSWPM